MLFAFKIFSLPVPTPPGTRPFLQVPDPSRPEVKNPYPSDPDHHGLTFICVSMACLAAMMHYLASTATFWLPPTKILKDAIYDKDAKLTVALHIMEAIIQTLTFALFCLVIFSPRIIVERSVSVGKMAFPRIGGLLRARDVISGGDKKTEQE